MTVIIYWAHTVYQGNSTTTNTASRQMLTLICAKLEDVHSYLLVLCIYLLCDAYSLLYTDFMILTATWKG